MFGDDGQYREASAKMFGTLLLTLEDTPFIYQGEEIGMTNVAFSSISDYRDLATQNLYYELIKEKGKDPVEALVEIHTKTATMHALGCNGTILPRQAFLPQNHGFASIPITLS